NGSDFDQKMCLAVFRSTELHDHLSRFPESTTFRALDPELQGYWMFFGRVEVGKSWFFHAPVPEDATPENYDFQGLLEKAAGVPFKADFDHVGFWNLRVSVADQYQVGRVFIAGDAAHSHPPYGGFGLNNGLEDVANLGWKIAARLQGWGGDALLESYSDERRQVFWETGEDYIAAGIRRDARFLETFSPEKDEEEFKAEFAKLGAEGGRRTTVYEPNFEGSQVVFGPADGVNSAHGSHSYTARAGHHLPPQRLSNGAGVHTEFDTGFTLLAFDAPDGSAKAFTDAAESMGVPLKVVEDTCEDGREQYEARLILVRPDQYCVWAADEAPESAVAVLKKVCGLG
ncbi:MAG: FAD-dependent monooxygenase, partial [Chloroflexota bacterium]|nr:FAD-dependent monooxygenase [Chloroflexota bacterium]